MRPIIAIDPGANGGIAYRNSEGIVTAFRMPATHGDVNDMLMMLICAGSNPVAVMELVGGFAGKEQPGSAMFNFGYGVGFIHGVLQTRAVPLELVRPQDWQKSLHLGTSRGMSKKDWKNKLKAEAQRRHPALKVTLNTADALLILDGRILLEDYARSLN